jgi:hypothetical protein
LSQMRTIFVIIQMLIVMPLLSQQNEEISFKVLVIKPDTAILSSNLKKDISSIQTDFLNELSYLKNQREILADLKEPLPDSVSEKKAKAIFDKKNYTISIFDINSFKYFDILSYKLAQALDSNLNSRQPYSLILEIDRQKTSTKQLKTLSRHTNADYVIYFKNIQSQTRNQIQELAVTIYLYSNNEDKIILSKDILARSNGDESVWLCRSTLSCLFNKAATLSAKELIPKLGR